MSKKSGPYHLTDEHFEREIAEINKLRSQRVAEHAHELEEFDRQFDRIAQLKADVAYLVERHAAKPGRIKIADVGRPTPAKPKRPTPSRAVPSGKPWTPEEDERLLSDDADQIRQLAMERGVTRYAILKRRTVLLQRRSAAESPTPPTPIETPTQTEASSSETADIFEPSATPLDKPENQAPPPEAKSATEASRPDDGRISPTRPEKVNRYSDWGNPPSPGSEPEAKSQTEDSLRDDGRISPTLQEKLDRYSQTERHPQRHPAIKDDDGFIRPPSMDRLRAGR